MFDAMPCSTVHFSWTRPDPTRPDPTRPRETLTRPAISDKKSDPTRPLIYDLGTMFHEFNIQVEDIQVIFKPTAGEQLINIHAIVA